MKIGGNLDRLKQELIVEIDQAAELARSKGRVSSTTQAALHAEKERQARAGEGALVTLEADRLKISLAEASARIIAAADASRASWVEIEAERLQAKDDIRAARSIADARSATIRGLRRIKEIQ